MKIIANRLANQGFNVDGSGPVSAKSKAGTILVDRVGLCWSTLELDDLILPVVPEILACKKEGVPLQALQDLYFKMSRTTGETLIRISTRVESFANWYALRSSGQCGLTPDERLVSSFFMKSHGNSTLVTDYPLEGSKQMFCGRKRYFETSLHGDEASSTLRAVGERRPRNSYLSRDATLKLDVEVSPSRHEIAELLNGLDEWCFLASA